MDQQTTGIQYEEMPLPLSVQLRFAETLFSLMILVISEIGGLFFWNETFPFLIPIVVLASVGLIVNIANVTALESCNKTAQIGLLIVTAIIHAIIGCLYYDSFANEGNNLGIRMAAIFSLLTVAVYVTDCILTMGNTKITVKRRRKVYDAELVESFMRNFYDRANTTDSNPVPHLLTQTELLALIDIRAEIHEMEQNRLSELIRSGTCSEDTRTVSDENAFFNLLTNPKYQPSHSELSRVKKMVDKELEIAEEELLIACEWARSSCNEPDSYSHTTRKQFRILSDQCLGIARIARKTETKQFREEMVYEEKTLAQIALQYFYNPILHSQGRPLNPLSQREWNKFKNFLINVHKEEMLARIDLCNILDELMRHGHASVSNEELKRLDELLVEVAIKIETRDFRMDEAWDETDPFKIGDRYMMDYTFDPSEEELKRLSRFLCEMVISRRRPGRTNICICARCIFVSQYIKDRRNEEASPAVAAEW